MALFLAGFAGGFAHCGPMCGPFVLAQLADIHPGGPVLSRLRGAALLPYHAGRISIYILLGAVMGVLGGGLSALTPFRGVFGLFLLLAAFLFLARALALLFPGFRLFRAFEPGIGLPAGLARRAGPVLARFVRPGGGGYPLGLMLGFLPCGFLYAALAAAGASGGAASGALSMAGFGLGTVPPLLAVGLLGMEAVRRWRRRLSILAAPILLFNAAILTALALPQLK